MVVANGTLPGETKERQILRPERKEPCFLQLVFYRFIVIIIIIIIHNASSCLFKLKWHDRKNKLRVSLFPSLVVASITDYSLVR